MHIFLSLLGLFIEYLQELIICATNFYTTTLGVCKKLVLNLPPSPQRMRFPTEGETLMGCTMAATNLFINTFTPFLIYLLTDFTYNCEAQGSSYEHKDDPDQMAFH